MSFTADLNRCVALLSLTCIAFAQFQTTDFPDPYELTQAPYIVPTALSSELLLCAKGNSSSGYHLQFSPRAKSPLDCQERGGIFVEYNGSSTDATFCLQPSGCVPLAVSGDGEFSSPDGQNGTVFVVFAQNVTVAGDSRNETGLETHLIQGFNTSTLWETEDLSSPLSIESKIVIFVYFAEHDESKTMTLTWSCGTTNFEQKNSTVTMTKWSQDVGWRAINVTNPSFSFRAMQNSNDIDNCVTTTLQVTFARPLTYAASLRYGQPMYGWIDVRTPPTSPTSPAPTPASSLAVWSWVGIAIGLLAILVIVVATIWHVRARLARRSDEFDPLLDGFDDPQQVTVDLVLKWMEKQRTLLIPTRSSSRMVSGSTISSARRVGNRPEVAVHTYQRSRTGCFTWICNKQTFFVACTDAKTQSGSRVETSDPSDTPRHHFDQIESDCLRPACRIVNNEQHKILLWSVKYAGSEATVVSMFLANNYCPLSHVLVPSTAADLHLMCHSAGCIAKHLDQKQLWYRNWSDTGIGWNSETKVMKLLDPTFVVAAPSHPAKTSARSQRKQPLHHTQSLYADQQEILFNVMGLLHALLEWVSKANQPKEGAQQLLPVIYDKMNKALSGQYVCHSDVIEEVYNTWTVTGDTTDEQKAMIVKHCEARRLVGQTLGSQAKAAHFVLALQLLNRCRPSLQPAEVSMEPSIVVDRSEKEDANPKRLSAFSALFLLLSERDITDYGQDWLRLHNDLRHHFNVTSQSFSDVLEMFGYTLRDIAMPRAPRPGTAVLISDSYFVFITMLPESSTCILLRPSGRSSDVVCPVSNDDLFAALSIHDDETLTNSFKELVGDCVDFEANAAGWGKVELKALQKKRWKVLEPMLLQR